MTTTKKVGSNLLQLLVSVMSHCSNNFCRFPGIFTKRIHLKNLKEICEQNHEEYDIQYNDEKEIIDSNINFLRKFQLRNMFLNI